MGIRTVLIPSSSLFVRYLYGLLACIYFAFRYRIRVIHLNGAGPASYALPLRLFGIRTIIGRHVSLQLESISNFRQKLYRLNCQWASTVITVSEFLATEHDFLPIAKVFAIPNWIDTRIASLDLFSDSKKTVQVLYVGRVIREKGVKDLITAMDGITHAQLDVVGDGIDRVEFQAYADSKAIRVNFYGWQENVDTYYDKADIFVQPSHSEGFSLVTMEAMAHGLPCVLSNIPAHVEISQNGQYALLFQAKSASDLHEKLILLASDSGMRHKFKIAGFHRIKEHYSPEIAKIAYIRIYSGKDTASFTSNHSSTAASQYSQLNILICKFPLVKKIKRFIGDTEVNKVEPNIEDI